MADETEEQPESKAPSAVVKFELAGISDILKALSNDGALAVLIGKPAAQAISQVIAGAASIPEAWFKARAQEITDGQAARTRISGAVAGSLEGMATKDQALVDRYAVRWLGQAVREQDNLEAIAAQAAAALVEEPSVANEPPSDDFLNRFTDSAAKASSEAMRDLFARVLAGEIRAPGRFSLAALHLFSIMDARLAEVIQRYASLTIANVYVLATGSARKGLRLQEARVLESFGLLSTGLNIPLHVAEGHQVNLIIPGYLVSARSIQSLGESLKVQCSLLSPLGKEVFGLVATKPQDELLDVFVEDVLGITAFDTIVAHTREDLIFGEAKVLFERAISQQD